MRPLFQIKNATTRSLLSGLLISIGMFGFGFLLVPIYDIFCKYTGLNGKPDQNPYLYQAEDIIVDSSREITIQFLATNNASINWDFKPTLHKLKVHPGHIASLAFYVRNPNNKDMVGQAIPSVSPFDATDFVHKTECFCFLSQPLGAFQEKIMPLKIIIDSELPKRIKKITLSYTLFDITDMETKGTAVRAQLEKEGMIHDL
ncbi:MAG: cytochrome c oxidase assembly protein [Endozoicomonadaceae bacterium]|nr:cytochrome c oxidase assembly protein [Endozoicomonadaceae bacterium]